jgi:hypothetical protein
MYGASDRGYADFRERTIPDVGQTCVIVPICTENALRFSTRLGDGAPEVHLERAVPG